MKPRLINSRWELIVPDHVAEWGGPTEWEVERLASMEEHLQPGMVLYDIGTEHGWLSAVYGSFTGHENMVLVEPTPEFWINIRKTWHANLLPDPIASFQAFCGRDVDYPASHFDVSPWPLCSIGFEDMDDCPAMAYPFIGDTRIDMLTIDTIATLTQRAPAAITVDVEGWETDVMMGARRTLAVHRPLVWISQHNEMLVEHGSSAGELNAFMYDHGYHRKTLAVDHEIHVLWTHEEFPR